MAEKTKKIDLDLLKKVEVGDVLVIAKPDNYDDDGQPHPGQRRRAMVTAIEPTHHAPIKTRGEDPLGGKKMTTRFEWRGIGGHWECIIGIE